MDDGGVGCGQAPWRLAFVSHGVAVVEATAGQGLAATVVKASTFQLKLRRPR
jgi:hypothetical protein